MTNYLSIEGISLVSCSRSIAAEYNDWGYLRVAHRVDTNDDDVELLME